MLPRITDDVTDRPRTAVTYARSTHSQGRRASQLWLYGRPRLLCVWILKELPQHWAAEAGYATSYGPLRPNVTSSIKPEVHNIAQRRQNGTKPRPQEIRAQNFVPIDPAFPEICSRTHRHTDRQTDGRTDRRVDHNTQHPYRCGVKYTTQLLVVFSKIWNCLSPALHFCNCPTLFADDTGTSRLFTSSKPFHALRYTPPSLCLRFGICWHCVRLWISLTHLPSH